ncbi:MAG TPA: CHAD domain-containing protein [Nocardia sp.]|uniref:CHAD domain-containing protein n=1 Tax=Nocardia sp. TaxID=1821 RepID=UPI002B4AB553|nr:CHAD domain-containing protein [Nocardia sp.]HLS79253.1 CHAD domain-containing protein [Nocardia sp.]
MNAGEAVAGGLSENIDRVLGTEPDVRADAFDSVHQMRVATRRLRSVLRSYRGLFRGSEARALEAELKWLAGLLGVARDAEVRAERFAGLAGDDDDPVRAAVVDRLVRTQREIYARAHRDVLDALDSDRLAALRDTLARWRADPPVRRRRGAAPAEEVFGAVLRRDTERLRARIGRERALAAGEHTADQRIEALHEIRKAAKRLRYSAEAAIVVLGEDADTLRARAKEVQSVLGDHRDAVEAAQTILATAASAEGADSTAGTDLHVRLAAAEEAAAERELARYPEAARSFAD